MSEIKNVGKTRMASKCNHLMLLHFKGLKRHTNSGVCSENVGRL